MHLRFNVVEQIYDNVKLMKIVTENTETWPDRTPYFLFLWRKK
jgi:hypothetical protein